MDELLVRPPEEGILLAADDDPAIPASVMFDTLGDMGVWLPMVFVAAAPSVERIVEAVKAGAIDYLVLPFEMSSFARHLDVILSESGQFAERRRREVEAQHAIGLLSRREREVLELLSAGCSNKEIARNLSISPRTVEIHRGNMMTKLNAGHAADAVRLWLDAREEAPLEPRTEALDPVPRQPDIIGRIGDRRVSIPVRPRRRVQRQ
ncbi:MAG TPA: LuxR C-terminal-related transcriptional regulator [Croceibacterium sp.]|nr:LuxR C-terminal-related transcriptional regulator [Croceibacterium sp.]